ncbi:Vi polysaccharide transport protein VexE [Citrobacter amalonaticus]|uniref:Vi polysaccharide transport protein VexE n=1 Tax=Citrobacter amalonaticus TaxID=35703 RepID=A0A2S4RVQ7_CITAM|nr:tetratricopeptide repeat protein [Citrobacter amalonaticus]POT56329.1 Vi polysaccharide transport protein VexE [Citrobacter amalonaticus]POT74854.1 Vi polysaccharide transport protein VexE [Citrobacter amalonaticus]POU64383.1 Vi polysaccharide transport protein VexE [Citrobacter amalonaticus]POV04219.1 Vi polysaccharide transport protein VexE [Citrobacter amalonaticus]
MSLYTTVEKISPTTLLKKENWEELCEYYRQHPTKVEETAGNAQHILLFAIAYLRKGEVTSGLSLLSDGVLTANNSRNLLRRWIISPLASRNLDVVLQVVNKLLAVNMCQPEDVQLVASCLIKCRHFNTVAELAERAWRAFPGNSLILSLCLRSLVLSEKEKQAIELARTQALANPLQGEALSACVSLLHKSREKGDKELAVSLLPHLNVDTQEAAGLVVDTLSAIGKYREAIQTGESALARGLDGAIIRRSLGLACYKSSRSREAKLQAAEHFRQAIVFNPDNLRAATCYADVLIRTGQNAQAIPLLERWLTSHPNLPYVRALYARALRQEGQYEAASAEFMRLASEKGVTSKWNRYAAAALLQAGKRNDAEAVFARYVQARGEHLANSFEEGLQALDEKIDHVNLPVERLDWAWEIGGRQSGMERSEWERRAKWGYLADNFLLDWLECRGQQADEPMYRLANIAHVEQFFERLQLDQRGCIVVSAHLGAMYAGPMIMSLLNMNSKWVASTPGVIKGGYGERLISVSDKSEAEVVRACVQTLHSGQSIVVAIDGALNLAAPTIEFHGQQITYSTFCSRLAWKMHLPTVFGVPVWREGHIHFVLEKMVDPLKFESQASFTERWKNNYLKCVTRILKSGPENLRLSGGIWRNIARKDESLSD